MALRDRLHRLEARAVTAVTPSQYQTLRSKPAPAGACTPVTSVTAQNNNRHSATSRTTPVAHVWHFLVDGKRITAIDRDCFSEAEFLLFLESKFGPDRVCSLHRR